jgi:hypothetical protein
VCVGRVMTESSARAHDHRSRELSPFSPDEALAKAVSLGVPNGRHAVVSLDGGSREPARWGPRASGGGGGSHAAVAGSRGVSSFRPLHLLPPLLEGRPSAARRG